MADYLVIVDDVPGDVWPSLAQAKGWTKAGNYDYAKSKIVIAKIVAVKKRNAVTQPKERFSDWEKE